AATVWADELCGAVTTWTDELQRIGDDLTKLSSLSVDGVRQAASDVGATTDAFLADVRALGAPDTESGDTAKSALDALADTLETEKRAIEDALDGVSGITGIASAVRTVASSLTTMGREFQRTFEELGDIDARGELGRAFEEADACDEFTR
ncbi:MAG TPA: hypothetical protein VK926_09750, partial [Gaiellaceae bacterium]|nr:hypothetical protein [Gaiellaceae bacterium]